MAIDLKKLLSAVQSKIGNLTPTSPSRQIEFLAKAAVRSGENLVRSYDSDGEFLDSATTSPYLMLYHTTDKNIYMWDSDGTWKPISGTVASTSTQAQGSTSGYTSGGGPLPTPGAFNIIDKFPFSSDGNATDVGDLSVARYGGAGQSSTASGYTSGGGYVAPPFTRTNTIDKFPFSSDGNATDVGDITVTRNGMGGQSSTVSGYNSGGYVATPSLSAINVIDKFPFASDANATDVGDITVTRNHGTGQSSTASGYTSGGNNPLSNVIDKFPFSSDANATDVGDLTLERYGDAGQSSSANGYTSGGNGPPSNSFLNIIDKFPFSSDANATDVGDMTAALSNRAPQSSADSGYNSGGNAATNIIDKFPFSSDANATDVGDLTAARFDGSGQQV